MKLTTVIINIEQGVAKVWSPGFNVKIVLLSRATGSVSSGSLPAFDVVGSKVCKIVGDVTGDARLLILLPISCP